MKKLQALLLAIFISISVSTLAQVCSPIAVTGFNIDAIAETAPNSLALTTQALDWSNNVMYSQNFAAGAGFGCGGILNSGTIVSGTRTYQLMPYNGNNCVYIANGNTSTINITAPAQYTFISLLLFSTEGGGNINVTFNYTNLTSTNYGGFFISDWFFAAGSVYSGFGRCTRVAAAATYDGCPTDPRFYPLDFTLSCADQQKSLKSITISTTSGNQGTYVMAVSGHLFNQVNTVSPIVNVSCNGGTNGSATASVTGGNAPYTYSWNTIPAQTTATASNLSAGTYTCTITDAGGCQSTITATITQPPILTALISASTNVSCNGGNNGSASVTAGGGTGAYTYSWTPSGGTGPTATGLTAGTYTVTVKDANGCMLTRTITITQPPALTLTFTQINVNCNVSCTGSATVTPAGGTPTYTYSWTPSGGTGATASLLCAGTYTCTVHDANNCVITQVITITQPPVLAATNTHVNVFCNGGNTGSATVTATGGTPAYTYSWSPSGGTGATASGLTAGTYTCTITDSHGCTTTSTVTITQPTVLAVTTTNVPSTCGSANGSATATATGGTGAYTYAWTPTGGNAATASGLLAGTYTITVHDANGCVATSTVIINSTGGITVTIPTSVNVTCNGGNNGSATASVTGGTAPYTYAWTPTGGTGATGTSLSAGTYTVTVHDANGCVNTATVTITQPPLLTATISASTNVSCSGGNNGSATVTAGGGTGAYTYAWTPTGGTGTTASGLTAGTYTITVHDANGCVASATVTITQPPLFTATNTHVNELCNGGNTASATVTASGGTGAYTYAWTPTGGTAATASGLTAGTYTCTIHDGNGCVTTSVVTITQPTVLALTTSNTPATCGNPNGSATVTATGGTGAYTYAWAPSGGTGATASGLIAGTYTVTVHDANGCVQTATVVVSNTGGPTVTITSSVNVSCNGGNNGSATSSVTGGTAPYTYAWTPTGGTGATGTALSAGTYTVTVHDANGCVTSATIVITQPAALTATISASTNVSCNGGNNGSATVTAGGGTAPYTYAWSPSGGTAATASALTAGTYTVTVTDAHGCTITATVVITQPPVLAATTTQVNELCNGGATASANAVPSGGTGAYTFSWTPSGGNASSATGLSAGTYTCTIHDANNCVTTVTVTITQPAAIALTTTSTPSTCGNPNGSATVTATGGTGAYTYAWAPSGGTAATAPGLVAGTYTVTVHDANGCVQTATVVVNNTGGPTVTITSSVNVSCNGGNNGSATSSVTGGTAPYTYAWTPTGGTGATGTALSAGTYTVTVHDVNGCITSTTVTITQPAVLAVTIPTSVNVSCFGGNNGSATSAVTGGTGPYTYAWTPSGGTGATGTALIAGTYTVTVTDAHGCTATANVTITQPTQLTATNSQTNVNCNGGTNGTATVTPAGATPAYTYSWNPGAQITATATNLGAGTYTCTITDAHGCFITSTVTITQPTPLTATSTNVGSTCGNPNGSATATGTGGTGPYGYVWNPGGQTTQTATGLAAGTYTCTVTDAHGCTTTTTTTIINAGSPVATISASTNVSCFGGNNGSATVNITGGTSPYNQTWNPGGQTTTTASALTAGTYTVTVTDANGCSTTASVTITQPPVLVVTIPSSVNVSCNGGNNGSATSNTTGGTGPYTYAWTPSGGTGANGIALAAGTFTVTATDAHGCTATATIVITQPPVLTATNTQVNESCNGGNNASATVTPAGGTAPYTYAWSPSGGTGATASGLTVGSYTCTITDNHGCTVTSTVTITQPTAIVLTMSSIAAHCGQPDGTAHVVIAGGTAPYTETWSPAPGAGQGTTTASGYIPGVVTLTVHDANGCVATNTVTISNVPGVLAVNALTQNVSCFNGSDGKDSVHASAGAPPYTYSWSTTPAQLTQTATGLTAGNYSCTVRDSAGCVSVVNVVITQPTLLTVAPMGHVTICIGSCTPLTATGGGGTPAYTFSWTNSAGPVTSPVCPVVTTTYTVVCTDAHGCTSAPGTVTITVNPPLEVTAGGTASICPGASTPLTSSGSGGNGTWSYSWLPATGLSNPAIQNPIATPASTTTYTVIVSDNCGTPTDSATVTVTIYPSPVISITSPDTAGCAPWIVTFNGTSNPGCATAAWQFGDGGIASGCGAQTHTYLNAGSYSITLSVTDIHGCAATLVKPNWITIYPVPEAAFTASPQPTTILASDITFTNHSTGAVTYNWNFGDIGNASSTLMSPHFAYPDTGCFTVTLVAKNSFGCLDTATSPICIAPDFTFFAPNAFTPNDDGKNDKWTPQGVGIDPNNYNLMMFDRWGNLIWYTTTWGQGWDGRANNGSDIAQQDAYVWKVKLKDFHGNSHSYTGVCNLIK